MTPDQYRTAIERLGLTQAQAAEYLGVSVRTSHGYANGAPIPVAVEKLLRVAIRDQDDSFLSKYLMRKYGVKVQAD
jgi:transcriptional regulator with XRE-family HTH domain